MAVYKGMFIPFKDPDERFDGSNVQKPIHNEGTKYTDANDEDSCNDLCCQSLTIVLWRERDTHQRDTHQRCTYISKLWQ